MNPFLTRFAGFRAPSSDMQAVRDDRRARPLYVELDLSTARSIAANTAELVEIAGNSFYADPIIDSAGSSIGGVAIVHFQDVTLGAQGTPFTVQPQFIARVPFTKLLVENPAQPGKRLRIIYGVDVDFQPGINAQVSIVAPVALDSPTLREIRHGDDIARDGEAFRVRAALGAGGAGTFNHVQLYNPSAAVFVYLDRIVICSDTTQRVTLREYDTALTTDGGTGFNNDRNGAASAAHLRTLNSGGGVGTVTSDYRLLANTPVPVEYNPPVRLGQNEGHHVFQETVNVGIEVNYFWRERAT